MITKTVITLIKTIKPEEEEAAKAMYESRALRNMAIQRAEEIYSDLFQDAETIGVEITLEDSE
ncbi:hypothetical protein [Sporosarcina sp. P17b]|uniref:hypothetical protein n=1 Tax=Sporosarcina sp. P17b TaxID=2048260 RepID=UPI000C167352|nr:hypothetical protein [Sporosarcina sp. P17b]PIC72409.1 hypothetical protein CSV76_15290 [Sporosarcina sp. P17b]